MEGDAVPLDDADFRMEYLVALWIGGESEGFTEEAEYLRYHDARVTAIRTDNEYSVTTEDEITEFATPDVPDGVIDIVTVRNDGDRTGREPLQYGAVRVGLMCSAPCGDGAVFGSGYGVTSHRFVVVLPCDQDSLERIAAAEVYEMGCAANAGGFV